MSNKEQIREQLIYEGGDENEALAAAPVPERKSHKVYDFDENNKEEEKELSARDKKMIGGCCGLVCLIIVIIIIANMFSGSTKKVVAVASSSSHKTSNEEDMTHTPGLIKDAISVKAKAKKVALEKKHDRNCSDSESD